jgi:hypothetical protein
MSFPSQTGLQSPCYLLSPRLQSSPFQGSPTQSAGSPSSRLSEPISIKIPKRQLFPNPSEESQDSGFYSGSPTVSCMRQRSCLHHQNSTTSVIYENDGETTPFENISSSGGVFQFDEEIVEDDLLLKTYSSARRASFYQEYSSPVHQPPPNRRVFNLQLVSNTEEIVPPPPLAFVGSPKHLYSPVRPTSLLSRSFEGRMNRSFEGRNRSRSGIHPPKSFNLFISLASSLCLSEIYLPKICLILLIKVKT